MRERKKKTKGEMRVKEKEMEKNQKGEPVIFKDQQIRQQ